MTPKRGAGRCLCADYYFEILLFISLDNLLERFVFVNREMRWIASSLIAQKIATKPPYIVPLLYLFLTGICSRNADKKTEREKRFDFCNKIMKEILTKTFQQRLTVDGIKSSIKHIPVDLCKKQFIHSGYIHFGIRYIHFLLKTKNNF